MRRGTFVAVVLCTIVATVWAQPRTPNPTNVLHMRSKPAIVRIVSGSVATWTLQNRQVTTSDLSSGSGFFINPAGYILTNAHVVSAIKDGDEVNQRLHLRLLAIKVLQAPPPDPVTEQNVAKTEQALVKQAQLTGFRRVNIVLLQNGKEYPFEIKSFGAPTGQGRDLATGKDIAVLKIETRNAPTLRLGDSDETQVGDPVWVLGYPGAADSDVLAPSAALEPTTNDGKISAKKMSADGVPILQSNASTTHGNSGGPAINEKGEVVGLLTFRGNEVNSQEVQGFNFIVTTRTAREFVRQAGTDNADGAVDKKWREGLDHYWRGEYTDSKNAFASVVALYPDHAEAIKLIQDSQERIERGEDRSGWLTAVPATTMLVVGGAAGLVGLLVIGGVVALVVFTRRSRSPAPHPAPAPAWSGSVSPPSPADAPPATDYTLLYTPNDKGKLVCIAGPLAGTEFPIGKGVYIGRDADRAQIVVTHPEVSGRHVWVGEANGRIVVRDSQSSNGTFLNDNFVQRITAAELKDGDVLALSGDGAVKFKYRAR
jgi:S1-C subfamily serine protease